MQRIVVLNPKGGSGKTTIAINLASYLASRQHKPVLMDLRSAGLLASLGAATPRNQPPIRSRRGL